MRLLSVDPGTKYHGLALWQNNVLERAWLQAPPLDEDDIFLDGALDAVVVEKPIIYSQWKQRGDPNDMIDLALVAGELVGMFRTACTDTKINYLKPYEWKGQIPKTDKAGKKVNIIPDRVRAALSADELARVELPRAVKTLGHNVFDAIGLGLVWSGRCQKGVI